MSSSSTSPQRDFSPEIKHIFEQLSAAAECLEEYANGFNGFACLAKSDALQSIAAIAEVASRYIHAICDATSQPLSEDTLRRGVNFYLTAAAMSVDRFTMGVSSLVTEMCDYVDGRQVRNHTALLNELMDLRKNWRDGKMARDAEMFQLRYNQYSSTMDDGQQADRIPLAKIQYAHGLIAEYMGSLMSFTDNLLYFLDESTGGPSGLETMKREIEDRPSSTSSENTDD